MLLRAMPGPTSVHQLATFVLPSLTWATERRGRDRRHQVPAILGTGTETQFQFQGIISSQKPFRDWLTEVLNCCLGFYTWEFGKLKLGCRINASAVDAYTLANSLFQSSAADADPGWPSSTWCFRSPTLPISTRRTRPSTATRATRLTTGAPDLRSRARCTRWACSTQPGAADRGHAHARRVGGVTPAEWRDARTPAWQTTLLGLGNEVGQVVSMTHPDIPGARGTCNVSGSTATLGERRSVDLCRTANGDSELVNKEILIGGAQVTITAVAATAPRSPRPSAASGSGLSFQVITMCFRIQRWSLKKDWSVQIEGQTVTESMYDLDVGPEADGRGARAPAADLLSDPARPGVGTVPGAGGFE
jgi:hypothetical protein